MSQVLKIDNIEVNLAGNVILNDVSFTLDSGDILGLVGPSGCGKTTLLNTMAGFIQPVAGKIKIGENIVFENNQTVAPEHRQIGMIFQDYALFPHLTVEENIAFGLKRMIKEAQQERIEQLLLLLKLDAFRSRYPHQLSGGQQQRVAIARALAPRPKLLLLDEPFSNIDARLRQELMLEIRSLLKQLKISAIFVTHNKDEVFTFADQMAVMHQGHLLQIAPPAHICQQPKSWQVADFLQLGSWLPYIIEDDVMKTALGDISFDNDKIAEPTTYNLSSGKLLIKPHDLSLATNGTKSNAKVTSISITEQGFHYYLAATNACEALNFQQLSFYSNELFDVGQLITLSINDHRYLTFS